LRKFGSDFVVFVEKMDDEHLSSYKWEEKVSNNWENDIQEDERGNIINVKLQAMARGQVQRRTVNEAVRRGLIRYLMLAVDCSASAAEKDYRPNRIMAMKVACERFILHFFDQNPISQLSLAQIQDSVARKLTDMSGNPKTHLERLRKIRVTKGLSSLQNTMKLAILALRHVPNYGHRELLIIYSSLSSTDPGSIEDTIQDAVENKIRISIVSLTAEIYVCKRIAHATGGTFSVAMDSQHLAEILRDLTTPSPQLQEEQEERSMQTDFVYMVYMGFPRRVVDSRASYVFDGKASKLACTSYVCPRCFTKTADIPTQCNSCTLQLNSSSHIARSFHHIFPVPQFVEVTDSSGSSATLAITETAMEISNSNNSSSSSIGIGSSAPQASPVVQACTGCSDVLVKDYDVLLKCPRCNNVFCVECDHFIHDSLHNCPGCPA